MANDAEELLYVHADHLGAPQKMTDGTRTVVWDAAFRPFGEQHALGGSESNNQRTPGQYFDGETGFHYNYWRDYDPGTGRYLQPDPIGLAGGLNRYLYANANPTRFTDPRGLNPAVGAIAGGSVAGPPGAVVGAVVGIGIGIVLGETVFNLDGVDDDTCSDEEKDCKLATKYQLRKAGIPGPEYTGEHHFKCEHFAEPESRFDICACNDGAIVIRLKGQCGRGGPMIPTDARWK